MVRYWQINSTVYPRWRTVTRMVGPRTIQAESGEKSMGFDLWPVRTNRCGSVENGHLFNFSPSFHVLPYSSASTFIWTSACHSGYIFLHFSNFEKLSFLNVSPLFELSFALNMTLDLMNAIYTFLLFYDCPYFLRLGAQTAEGEGLWLNIVTILIIFNFFHSTSQKEK